jgi:hypothetical protein
VDPIRIAVPSRCRVTGPQTLLRGAPAGGEDADGPGDLDRKAGI